MTDYINVNGAKIERSYLEDSVAEARECDWASAAVFDDHVHCVCGMAIASGMTAFRAETRWLCQYCMDNLVAELGPSDV